jgi:thiamine transport system substrate-binding protein
MKALATIGATLCLTITLGACGSSSGKAAAAPKTVVLLSHDSFAVSKSVLADFTKETGYKVKRLAPGDAAVAVNTAILRKRHPVADVLFGVDNTFLTRALDAGIFTSYKANGLGTVPARYQLDASRHRVTPIDNGDVCIVYDRAWFGKAGRPAPPSSITDLTKPAYKKLTVVENPATSSPGLAFQLATIKQQGGSGWKGYWQALRANGVRVDDDWTQAYETDFTAGGGNGDRPIVVSYATDPAADVVFANGKKTTPSIGVVSSSCFSQVEFAGVLRGAKNEKGARALVDFMLSRQFQEDIPLQMYVFPVQPSARLPEVFLKWAPRPAHPLTMSPRTIGAHRNDWIKEWTEIVVR